MTAAEVRLWTGTHQMSVNGKRDAITRQDLLASAKTMGIRKHDAEEAIAAVQASLAKWSSFAEEARIREAVALRISKQFVDI